jgi:uncharacterized membrane protein
MLKRLVSVFFVSLFCYYCLMTQAALLSGIFGLLAAFSWGIADFFAAKGSKKITAESAALGISWICAVVYGAFFLLQSGLEVWTVAGFWYGAAAGIFMGLGLLLFYRGLEAGPVSVVSPIGSAYPLVTTILVLAVFGGSLSGSQMLGIALIIAGIIAASGLFGAKTSERRITAGVGYGLLTFLAWGVAFALLGQGVAAIGWQKGTLVDIWFEFLAILIMLPLLGHKAALVKGYRVYIDKFIIGSALIQLFGLVIFDVGLTITSSTAVITAISASYPALTVFLAWKHLGEKQTVIPLAGAVVTVIGVIVLSLH